MIGGQFPNSWAKMKEWEATIKEVTVLKSRKRGRPKLLPEDIMAKTIQSLGFTFKRCSCKYCCH